MTPTRTDSRRGDSKAEPKATMSEGRGSRSAPPQSLTADHPRLIEEHFAVGPHGEDEVEATDELGRRWYHLRPGAPRRYDLIGFNYTWWLIWIAIVFFVFLPWGHGWGY